MAAEWVPSELEDLDGDLPQARIEDLVDDLAECVKTTTTYANPSWIGSIAQSKVTNLVSDLAAKAALAGATFTGSIAAPRIDCTANNSGLWTSNPLTRVYTDGSTTWAMRASSSIAFQINGANYLQMDTGGGLRVFQPMRLIAVADATAQSGAIWWSTNTADVLYAKTPSNSTRTFMLKETLTLPVMADASIPLGGLAWSSTDANVLKCRTPAGTLKVVDLT